MVELYAAFYDHDRTTVTTYINDNVAVQRLTHRRVVAFMSANQTNPGVASELFFLDPVPPRPLPNAGCDEPRRPE